MPQTTTVKQLKVYHQDCPLTTPESNARPLQTITVKQVKVHYQYWQVSNAQDI